MFYPYCQIISIIFLKIIICTWSRGRSLRWRIYWDSFAEDKHLSFFATNPYNHCAFWISRAFFFCFFQGRKSKLLKYLSLVAVPIRLELPFGSKCFLNLVCRDKMFDILKKLQKQNVWYYYPKSLDMYNVFYKNLSLK